MPWRKPEYYLDGDYYYPRDIWENNSGYADSAIQALIPVGPLALSSLRSKAREDGGQIAFKLDTGCAYTLFKGFLADRLYRLAGAEHRQVEEIEAANGAHFAVKTAKLSFWICGKWIPLKCYFHTTDLSKGRFEFTWPALLGTRGLLCGHLLTVSKDGVEVFRRTFGPSSR